MRLPGVWIGVVFIDFRQHRPPSGTAFTGRGLGCHFSSVVVALGRSLMQTGHALGKIGHVLVRTGHAPGENLVPDVGDTWCRMRKVWARSRCWGHFRMAATRPGMAASIWSAMVSNPDASPNQGSSSGVPGATEGS